MSKQRFKVIDGQRAQREAELVDDIVNDRFDEKKLEALKPKGQLRSVTGSDAEAQDQDEP